MAGDIDYGGSGAGFSDTVARMKAQAAAQEELRRKDEQLKAAEESLTTAHVRNAGARTETAQVTDKLTSALERSIAALHSEMTAVDANTAAWERLARAKAGAGGSLAVASGGGGARPPAERPVAFATPPPEPDPSAAARLSAARQAQAAAEIAASQAAAQYTSATRRKGADPQEAATALEARDAARSQAAAARRETAAAEAAVAASEAAVVAQRNLAEALASHAAAERVAAQAASEAAAASARLAADEATAVLTRRQAALPTGPVARDPLLLGAGPARSTSLPFTAYLQPTAPPRTFVSGVSGLEEGYTRQSSAGPSGGLAVETTGIGQYSTAEKEVLAQTKQMQAALASMDESQAKVNATFRQSVAAYAQSSQALQRHGALTSEFIQAFARGEVTLREFQSQMLTTIGKFSGWAIAGGLVYGAYDALKKLGEGAADTQNTIVQLTRFNEGGGLGTGAQQGAALRNISTDLNVPIKEVSDAMLQMARVFKQLPDLTNATKAVVLAQQLDQIAPAESAQYFTGISQGLGFADKPGGGAQLLKVLDSLNSLQNQLGARVGQTLPGLAKSAPAALAVGIDTNLLEGLVAVGVRSGLTGAQVATGIVRSATTFTQKPLNQQELRSYGIDPTKSFNEIINQALDVLSKPGTGGARNKGVETRDIAVALFGPQLGGRTGVPLLRDPTLIREAQQIARNPTLTAEQERQKQLDSVKEQAHSVAIALENIGSEIASSGLIQVVQSMIGGFALLLHGVEALAQPVVAVGNIFNELPGPIKDVAGSLVALALAQKAYRAFAPTAGGALGRFPGLGFLDTPANQAYRELRQTNSLALGAAQLDQERAASQFRVAGRNAAYAQGNYGSFLKDNETALANPNVGFTKEGQVLLARDAELQRQVLAAEGKVQRAQQEYNQALAVTADEKAIEADLTNKKLSIEQRVAAASRIGVVAQSGTPNILPLRTARGTVAAGESVAAGEVALASGIILPRGAAATAAASARAVTTATNATRIVTTETVTQVERFAAAVGEQLAIASIQLSALSARSGALGIPLALGSIGAAGASTALPGAILGGAGILGAARSRLGGLFTGGVGFGAGATTALTGVLLAQLAGSAIGGGAGGLLQQLGTGGALGLAAGQLIPRIGAGPGIALGLGAAAAGAAGVPGGAATGLFGAGGYLAATRLLGLGGFAGAGLGAAAASIPIGLSLLSGHGTIGAVGGGALAGAGAGALAGAAIGSVVPFAGTGIGAVVGGLVGGAGGAASGAAGTIAGIFGGKDPKDVQKDLARRLAALSASGASTQQDLYQYGQDFAQTLDTAFNGTGDAAKQALTTVQKEVTKQQAQLKLFGAGSQPGNLAAGHLQSIYSAAVQGLAQHPEQIDQYAQILDTVDSSLKGAAQAAFSTSSALASSSAGREAALQQYVVALQQDYQSTSGSAIDELQKQRADLVKLIAKATGDAHTKLTKQLATLNTALAQAQAAGAQQLQANQVSIQQAAQANYSAEIGHIQAQAALPATLAGPDRQRQLVAQATPDIASYEAALKLARRDPVAGADAIAQAQAKLEQAQQSTDQETLARMKAAAAVTAARVPTGDTVGVAQQVKAEAEREAAFVKAHPKAFSFEDRQAALAAVLLAGKALDDTIRQSAVDLLAIQTQIAQAQDYLNPIASARDALNGATKAAGLAKTPKDRLQAHLNVVQAQNSLNDATFQQATQLNQLATQISEARSAQNPVAAARAALAGAQRAKGLARTPAESQQAVLDIINAQNQLQQAIIQNIQADTALAASQTNDPLKADRINLQGARQVVAASTGIGKIQAKTQLNQIAKQYQDDIVSQRESTINFQLTMQQISTQQAINQLQDLLKLKTLTLTQRQQILQQVRQLQQGGGTGGQFDIAPGGSPIKLPTVYDVHRAIGDARRQLGGAVAPQHTTTVGDTVFNIDLRNASDLPGLADTIDRALGSQLHAQLRAAGMRGT